MIQRFCFVKLLGDEVATRAELAAMLRSQLRSAGAQAQVGVPADDSAAKWDLSIVVAAPSLDAWHALSAKLSGMFDDLVGRAEVVKAWTFEAE